MKLLTLLMMLMIPTFALSQELNILTWNTFMLPKPLKFSYQDERSKIIKEQLKASNYDVVFLQESFSPYFRLDLKATKSKYPYQALLDNLGSGDWRHVMNSGLYILSRYPFKVLGKTYFRNCAGADCYSSKGALLAEFTVGLKKVQIGTTHLQSGGTRSRNIRTKQLNMINALFEKYREPGVSQILTGDLNISSADDEFTQTLSTLEMESSPLEGTLQHTSGFPVTCYCKPGGNTPDWIDHVLVRPNHSVTQVLHKKVRSFRGMIKGRECDLSDHYGIEATIRL